MLGAVLITEIINNKILKKMNWTKTTENLPKSGILNLKEDDISNNNVYHLVRLKNYGEHLAMYLEDENGECGWYSSYVSKIIVDVIEWCAVR